MDERTAPDAATPWHRPDHPVSRRAGVVDVRPMNPTLLWVIAVIIAIIGIIQLFQGQIIFGIILLVVAAAVGPGGWSIFNRNR
jgi:fatty acid desaturase